MRRVALRAPDASWSLLQGLVPHGAAPTRRCFKPRAGRRAKRRRCDTECGYHPCTLGSNGRPWGRHSSGPRKLTRLSGFGVGAVEDGRGEPASEGPRPGRLPDAVDSNSRCSRRCRRSKGRRCGLPSQVAKTVSRLQAGLRLSARYLFQSQQTGSGVITRRKRAAGAAERLDVPARRVTWSWNGTQLKQHFSCTPISLQSALASAFRYLTLTSARSIPGDRHSRHRRMGSPCWGRPAPKPRTRRWQAMR